MDWIPPKSPLKNGLFVRRPLANALLTCLNGLFRRKHEIPSIPTKPKKILVCNIANFGDVVISTAVLPLIKSHYPDCEIGFLTSSSSLQVIKEHPLISKCHAFDHFFLKRNLFNHYNTYKKTVKELKESFYEVAIDLYSYFPNAIPLLAKSGIPVRIGYPTGGFSHLLTHPVAWNFQDRYVGFAHLYLLKTLGIDVRGKSPLPNYRYKQSSGDYIAIHMGSLAPLKEWDLNRWIELIIRLQKKGEKIVLTGKGPREKALCQKVYETTGASDLSDQLNWKEFVRIIQEAKLVIAVDSAAVHIAAGSATPTLVLFSGINSPYMWVPPFSHCKFIMNRVSCSPCFKKKGCSSMSCVREIEAEAVYAEAMGLLCQN